MTANWKRVVGVTVITAVAGASTLVLGQASRSQEPRRAAPPQTQAAPITPHSYPLDDANYLRWPLPPGQEAYGRINGDRIKPWVHEITAISRKSRDDGERYWGRISGTKYDLLTEDWVEKKFREFGLQNVRRQWFDLPPQWFPTTWEVSATGGEKTLRFESARPSGGSPATPAAGLELEPVWVGLGTEADFAGRDVKGKLVLIQSVPTPSVIQHSAAWNGALRRAGDKGAAAVLLTIGVPGNFQSHLNRGGGVPTFTLGTADFAALRELVETTPNVKVKVQLSTEERRGLRDASVWGELPGATDEDIIVMAHHDAYFEGALDNASGMSVMVALAEHFSKIPQAQRRRTVKFVSTSGHHNGSLGTQWMSDNKATFLKNTALLINSEHVSVTQTYYWGPNLRQSNTMDARRWWVFGSDKLAALTLNAYRTFGVAVYHEMEPNASGDMGHVSRDAPSIQMIESPAFYHTDRDRPDVVPAAGLEAVARAFAKIIDDVNKLDRKDLVGTPRTQTTSGIS